MKQIFFILIPFILLLISCSDEDFCNELACNLICESGYLLDDNNCPTCECVEYREQYIGQWEFTKNWNVTHPWEPSNGDLIWTGEITYGNSDSTLLIPYGPILDGYNSCFCYEFQINKLGEMINDSYDADFNYNFSGYITPDSIFYTTAEGSPFSSYSQTIYGTKIVQ
mgnify:CR=1 FL=1